MEVRITPIPDGSHEIRIWTEDHNYGDDIDAVAVLHHLGDGRAEVALAHGHLTNSINMVIGMQAHQLGYRTLIFRTRKDHNVTRWAQYIGRDGDWDLWQVDLDDALARALSEGAL